MYILGLAATLALSKAGCSLKFHEVALVNSVDRVDE
jgi:hypothetical protein